MLGQVDAVIVGAGFSGAVCAEQLASAGKTVLVVERGYTGGHCSDFQNEQGNRIHRFGPHIFHTDNEQVWNYVSRFTPWHYYQHTVVGLVEGRKVPIPFNINSLEALFSPELSRALTEKLIQTFGWGRKVPILQLKEADDKELAFLADYIYEHVFLHYTMKQWGKTPDEIDPSVSGRVPVMVSRDNRYFTDRFQGIPLHGYTHTIGNMLRHPNIHLLTQTDALDFLSVHNNEIRIEGKKFEKPLIYTGMVDELFGFSLGELPYRSVNIQFEDTGSAQFQETALVNYPNNYAFTRITEYKHFLRDSSRITRSTISREYPVPYERGKNHPFYVLPGKEREGKYALYRELASKVPNLYLTGRLADYRYYDMDDAVLAALETSENVKASRQ